MTCISTLHGPGMMADLHPELVDDLQSHPGFCRMCYEVHAYVNSDQVCDECSGEAVEFAEDDMQPSAEYLMKWERTW